MAAQMPPPDKPKAPALTGDFNINNIVKDSEVKTQVLNQVSDKIKDNASVMKLMQFHTDITSKEGREQVNKLGQLAAAKTPEGIKELQSYVSNLVKPAASNTATTPETTKPSSPTPTASPRPSADQSAQTPKPSLPTIKAQRERIEARKQAKAAYNEPPASSPATPGASAPSLADLKSSESPSIPKPLPRPNAPGVRGTIPTPPPRPNAPGVRGTIPTPPPRPNAPGVRGAIPTPPPRPNAPGVRGAIPTPPPRPNAPTMPGASKQGAQTPKRPAGPKQQGQTGFVKQQVAKLNAQNKPAAAGPKPLQQGDKGFVKQQAAKLNANNKPAAAAPKPAAAPPMQEESATLEFKPERTQNQNQNNKQGGKKNSEENDFMKQLLKLLDALLKGVTSKVGAKVDGAKPGGNPPKPGLNQGQEQQKSITITFKGPGAHQAASQFAQMLQKNQQDNKNNPQTPKIQGNLSLKGTKGADNSAVDSLKKNVTAAAAMLNPKPQPGQGNKRRAEEQEQQQQQQQKQSSAAENTKRMKMKPK